MYHDEIPERCKLNFTGIVDDALRIAGELFPKQTLKKYIRKEVEIDTDGRVRSRRFEKKKRKVAERLWNGQVPRRCQMQYSENDVWRCYFGYRIYSTLQSPVFVFQWLFDEAQMTADNVGAPVSKPQWDYIHKMGNDLRTSLENVT
ncbi:palmitoleoyl-protein carboxylesterase NOTUM [Trichonephila clavipes]|nr:palmitoleoyl-protein carboxylesterase NOTUM [Trichonephila clavipes]